MLVSRCICGLFLYDLSFLWCPFAQAEDFGELVVGGGGLGEHSAGLGTATGRGLDEDCFLNPGVLAEEVRADRFKPACSASRHGPVSVQPRAARSRSPLTTRRMSH